MSASADAQARVIDNARVAWHAAISALDEARASAELLMLGHLIYDEDYSEATSSIDQMTKLFTDLIAQLDLPIADLRLAMGKP